MLHYSNVLSSDGTYILYIYIVQLNRGTDKTVSDNCNFINTVNGFNLIFVFKPYYTYFLFLPLSMIPEKLIYEVIKLFNLSKKFKSIQFINCDFF